MRKVSKQTGLIFGIGGGAVVAFLAFGVFGVQTLFIDKAVDEGDPFATTATTVAQTATTEPAQNLAPDSVPEKTSSPDTAPPETAPPVTDPVVTTLSVGDFVSGEHPTSGDGVVISNGSESFLRFENFETDNGPDLNVYLRSSTDPGDYLDLGDLKGNIGDQNYELPAGFDAARYDLVDIWCVRFGVSFGSAQLAAS